MSHGFPRAGGQLSLGPLNLPPLTRSDDLGNGVAEGMELAALSDPAAKKFEAFSWPSRRCWELFATRGTLPGGISTIEMDHHDPRGPGTGRPRERDAQGQCESEREAQADAL